MIFIYNIKTKNIYEYLSFLAKIKKRETKEKYNSIKYSNDFNLRLNRRTASLLSCCLAFVVRSMWYYRVEDVDVWDYLDREDFDKSFNDLRYMMLFIDGKSEETFENYKNYKVFIDK